jgi:hypothetical protein
MSPEKRKVPLLLWPFWALWRLLAFIIGLTGRLVAIVLGFALMIIGAILIVTIVALPIGVPVVIFGFLLVIRGIF